jgi:hypothetical protein
VLRDRHESGRIWLLATTQKNAKTALDIQMSIVVECLYVGCPAFESCMSLGCFFCIYGFALVFEIHNYYRN